MPDMRGRSYGQICLSKWVCHFSDLILYSYNLFLVPFGLVMVLHVSERERERERELKDAKGSGLQSQSYLQTKNVSHVGF